MVTTNNELVDATPATPTGWYRMPCDRKRFSAPVYTNGQSIYMPHVIASAWGGPGDRGDDGQTASGIRTDGPGGVVGCSLPMPAAKACHGSPIAQLPWNTVCLVRMFGDWVEIPLIDEGPGGGLSPCRMIDLTIPAWALLLNRKVVPEEVNDLMGYVDVFVGGVGRYQAQYVPSRG